ncbi:MAG: DUF58 domain-containing protein, partial [Planctomycetaceae bacterium]|nr:DUF58 domain-containing protein [Planctomycetaceae bacterium]
MMEPAELLKNVRRVEIIASRAVNDLFAGQYKSVFRGRGMEFSEVREYQPGDDIRSIDWNVTARAGKPFLKHFVEERELTILFLMDISASGIFGSIRSKLETAVEMAATLMFSALRNNDKVGLITFADQVLAYYPPRKGKANVLHLIRELLAAEPSGRQTNIKTALDYVNRVQKRRAVVFLLSDFLVPELTGTTIQRFWEETDRKKLKEANHFLAGSSHLEKSLLFYSFQEARLISRRTTLKEEQTRALSMCVRKHDLIALRFSDPREREFPNVGLVTLRDAETGELFEVDTANSNIRQRLSQELAFGQDQITETLKRCRVDQLRIETGTDFTVNLKRFFRMREK